jgi:hypothetical protein
MELITKQQSERQHVSTRDDSKSKDTCERKVTFDSVQVRLYSQTLGDNPSVSCGPPITLDWHYEEEPPMGIDEHQGSRVLVTRGQPRRFCLNYHQRCTILTYCYGFTKAEIKRAERQADKARSQRKTTIFLMHAMMVEDFLGSAARKTKRLLFASLNNHNASATTTTTTTTTSSPDSTFCTQQPKKRRLFGFGKARSPPMVEVIEAGHDMSEFDDEPDE